MPVLSPLPPVTVGFLMREREKNKGMIKLAAVVDTTPFDSPRQSPSIPPISSLSSRFDPPSLPLLTHATQFRSFSHT